MKSLVDKDFARKGARRVGDTYRMPCRVRKEVWLEPRRVRAPLKARIRKKTKNQIREGVGVNCAPRSQHGRVPVILFIIVSSAVMVREGKRWINFSSIILRFLRPLIIV